MPTSCRCRTALATQSQSHLHTPGCTSPSTSPRHTSIPTPPCIPSNTRPRPPPGSRHQNALGCLVLCARAPHDCLIPNHHSSHRHLLTLEPSIICFRLCARAHHARPIPHRHPSHRHLLIALARHALPALPASPAHTPLPRFAPGSCAHIVRQLKTEMSGSARSADLFQKTHNVEQPPPTRAGPVVHQVKPMSLAEVPLQRCGRVSFVTPRRYDAPQGAAEGCF